MRFSHSLAQLVLGVAFVSLVGTQSLWAWGSDGHMMINYMAAEHLPDDVPYFVRNPNGLDVIRYLGPEPDRWRGPNESQLAATQAPDHFINMEWAELAATPCTGTANGCVDGYIFPEKRYDFIRALAAAQAKHPNMELTPEKIGMQPWQVEEVWQRLKIDFRDYRAHVAAHEDTAPDQVAILFDTAWLGHYVADGSQPLHTTIEYNGWVGPNPHNYTTSHKIHWQFESLYVHANITREDVEPLVAATQPALINDEWTQYLEYLHHTNSEVERVYQLDQQGGFTGAGTPEAKTFTEQCLANGAIELRNLIYSAWVHSADPVPEYHGE